MSDWSIGLSSQYMIQSFLTAIGRVALDFQTVGDRARIKGKNATAKPPDRHRAIQLYIRSRDSWGMVLKAAVRS